MAGRCEVWSPWSRRTEYTYADPYFDGRRRDFRGFERATTRVLGDTHTPTLVTDSRTLLGTCVDDTPSDGIDECAPDQSWSDNPSEALKGLPAEESVHDAGTTTYSTTHRTYTLRTLAQGVDGRLVRSAFQSRTDSWIYDASAAPSSSATTITLHDVEREAGFGVGVMADAHDVTLAPVSFAHVRSEQSIDAFGNATTTTAYGCVDGAQCEQADEAITTTTAYALPSGDPSGWRWRPIETYVTGSAAPLVKRHRTFHAYDVRGALVGDSAELTGTLALDRHHHDGLDVAPAPSGASSDGTLALGTYDYDEFGNVVTRKGPNGQCTTTNYGDDPFRQFATTSTRWIGAVVDGCGTTALSARATYDRALERPLTTTDANGAKSRAEYDAFGRLARRYGPAGVGVESSTPELVVEYKLAGADSGDPAYSIVHVSEQDGAALSDASYHERWTFVDGMGRTRLVLSEADASHGDGGDWVVSGYTRFDTRGNPFARYHASWSSGSPAIFALRDFTPATPFRSTRFDALGRSVEEKAEDSATIVSTVHHALSVDVWDGEDLKPSGDHAGTPSTAAKDGHGCTIRQTSRLNGGSEMTDVLSEYLPTGELAAIRRVHDGDAAGGVTRWFRYDSLGRRVLNVEPSATVGFTSDTSASADSMKAWRYAYDDSGRLVGTSDARGCGVNFHYDVADRLLAEDYSPCRSGQTYSAPNFANGTGIEVLYRYDGADPDWTNIEDGAGHRLDGSSTYTLGRLASVSSLGAKTVYRYDLRGRTTGTARRIAKPGAPSASLADRYASRWYVQEAAYDAADRPVQRTTGSTAFGATSAVTTAYSARGVAVAVDSTYGSLVASRHVDADGRPVETTYADAAETQRGTSYDVRGRVSELMTVRSAAPLWSAPTGNYVPPGSSDSPVQQLILDDSTYEYDEAGNVTAIHDWRTASEWPDGAKPVSRTIGYDDLYRVTSVAYEYPAANDNWLPLLAEEDADGHSNPSPRVDFDSRVRTESFAYDWLGNTTETTDDALGFYDRSLGTITNGGGSYGPYQLTAASNLSIQGATGRRGDLETSYDEAGNMTGMVVRRDGPCRPSGASCWQRFAYEWDEVGRLSRAFRWDLDATEKSANGVLAAEPPSRAPDVDLAYAYDASDERVLKTATDASDLQRHTVYVFGSLELRSAEWTGTDYGDTTATEAVYLPEARLYYSEDDLPSLASGYLHVLLQIGDSLGSASIAIDRDTGELVERGTYTAYGRDESDYRPERWGGFREAHRFTGKEEDIEVGLTYFGKRYYAPEVGRWISADPLAVHRAQADLNVYAYVYGRTFVEKDARGLMPTFVVGAIIGAIAGGALNVAGQVRRGGAFNWGSFASAVFVGAAVGATLGAASGLSVGQAGIGGLPGASSGALSGGAWGAGIGTGVGAYEAGRKNEGFGATAARMGEGFAVGGAGGALSGASAGFLFSGSGSLATAARTMLTAGGAINGGMTGARQVYRWRDGSGFAALGADSTWSLAGTTLGSVALTYNEMTYGSARPADYDDDLSTRQNRQVYHGGAYLKSGFAFTEGNVNSSVGYPNCSTLACQQSFDNLLNHEGEHITQQRLEGPLFEASYAFTGAVGLWAAGECAMRGGCDPGAMLEDIAYYGNPNEGQAYGDNNPYANNPPDPW